MKTPTNASTLALMARVARVREVQAEQALAAAIELKDAQQERARGAQVHADRSDAALLGALSGTVVDVLRLPLLQELSAHVQATLTQERAQLVDFEQQVTVKSADAGKQARFRERLEEKSAIASLSYRQAHESRQLEFATEAWLVRRHREAG